MAASDDSKIQQYMLLAKGARGRGLADLINKATSEPSLFAFGELIDVPSISDIQKGELAPFFNLLQLFAFGTWTEYKEQSGSLPAISDQQRVKLKQLTVVSLAVKTKTISYQSLMAQLDIPTVRELEDFIITECFYYSIIKGKLDQKQHCLHVHDVIGRDVRQSELKALDQGLGSWLATSEELMRGIEQRIQFSIEASDAAKKHQADVDAKLDEVKKSLKTEMEFRSGEGAMDDAGDYMEEDRIDRPGMGMGGMERGERSERMRPKSRRR